MPVATLTAAGTRQRLVAVPSSGLPAARWVNRVTILILTGTTAYLGMSLPAGVQDAVSSTVNDMRLTSALPSFTVGPIGDGNNVDLCNIWWDGDTNGMTINFAPVSV